MSSPFKKPSKSESIRTQKKQIKEIPRGSKSVSRVRKKKMLNEQKKLLDSPNVKKVEKSESDAREIEFVLKMKWVNWENFPVFGSSLQCLFVEQGKDVERVEWVCSCVDYLVHGLKERARREKYFMIGEDKIENEDCFIVNGFLYQCLCEGRLIHWDAYEFKYVAYFLLAYFDNLPEPLLTLELHDHFIGASLNIWCNDDGMSQMEIMKCIIYSLPELNRRMLQKLMYLFRRVKNVNEISSVWGPILLLKKSIHFYDKDTEDSEDIFKLLVLNYEYLFIDPYVPKKEPIWLIPINTKKLELFTAVIQKLKATRSLLRDLYTEYRDMQILVQPCTEYKNILTFSQNILESIKKLLINVELKTMLDTYHLFRAYRYLTDLYDTFITENSIRLEQNGLSKLVYQLGIPRLRGSIEKIFCQMLYEIHIFCEYVDSFLLPTPMSEDVDICDDLSYHTYEIIKASSCVEAADFWARNIGHHKILVGWACMFDLLFNEMPCNYNLNAVKEKLRTFLDPFNTSFVTVNRLSQLFSVFNIRGYSSVMDCAFEFFSLNCFHANITSVEVAHLMMPYKPGSYLIRNSSSPGHFAYSWKSEYNEVLHTLISPSENGYQVTENSGTTRDFYSIEELIDFYTEHKIISHSIQHNPCLHPGFYEHLSSEESYYYLSHEHQGTYIIRYSEVDPTVIVCSYVYKNNQIRNVNLQRRADGTIILKDDSNFYYLNIEDFLSKNLVYFHNPYKNTVSLQMELEERLRHITASDTKAIKELFSLKNRSENILPLSDEFAIPTKSKLSRINSNLLLKKLSVDKDGFVVLSINAHKNHIEKKGKTRNTKIKVSEFVMNQSELLINQLYSIWWTAENHHRFNISYLVDDSWIVNPRYFITTMNPIGTLKKNSELKLSINFVLYKPVIVKEMLKILFFNKKENFEEWFHVPLILSPNQLVITHDIIPPIFWEIDTETAERIEKDILIGRGATASVMKGTFLGADVAIKTWELGQRQLAPQDFQLEIEMFTSLQHKNLLQIIGASNKPGNIFLLTEYCANSGLDEFIEKHKRVMTFSDKLLFAYGISSGINYMHQHNKIHRDLKSSNILVTSSLGIKVADFGVAKDMQSEMTSFAGTEDWMAPEVYNVKGIFGYSTKADIFSFGVILWELLEMGKPQRTRDMISKGTLNPISEDKKLQVPKSFISLMKMCVRYQPQKRPAFFVILKHIEKLMTNYGNSR